MLLACRSLFHNQSSLLAVTRIRTRRRATVLAAAIVVASSVAPDRSLAAGHLFTEAEAQGGRLFYHDDVPVVVLSGSPSEIGRQHAALLGPGADAVLEFPKKFIEDAGAGLYWPLVVQAGRTLMMRVPARFQEELRAAATADGISEDLRDVLPVANTLLELRRLGCSAIAIEDERTAGNGPLVGRNFDFPTLGILNRYSVLFIVRPEGRHAFASIGFPGLGGVLSGMNDAGLAVATLDVYRSADKSRKFDPTGTPLAFVFRRILEECTTVEEAEALLRAEHATTWMNLIACDPIEAAVFELTPATVARRDAVDAVVSCTNHFRSEGLSVGETCWRYPRLAAAIGRSDWDVASVQRLMHSVNQGEYTMQTMVFEPRSLRLHFVSGELPCSNHPLTSLGLRPLLAGDSVAAASSSAAE